MTATFVSPALPISSRSAFTPLTSFTSLRPSSTRVSCTPLRRSVRMIGGAATPPPPAEDTGSDSEKSEGKEGGGEVPAETAGESQAIEDSEDDGVEVLEECSPPQSVLNAEALAEARAKFRVHETDSGSPEYQIATLTTRIAYLTKHLKANPKDNSSTRGLLKMVATRTKLLKFLKREDTARFHNIIEGLNIRISQQLRKL